MSVGPAGVALTIEPAGGDGPRSVMLLNDGGVVFDTEMANRPCCVQGLGVGEDRVLVRNNETLDVFRLDGTLEHVVTWSNDPGPLRALWSRFRIGLGELALLVVFLTCCALAIGFAANARLQRDAD